MRFQFLSGLGLVWSGIVQRTWLQAGLAMLPMLLLLTGLPTKEFRYDLDPTKAKLVLGHAYVWQLSEPSLIWELASDTMQAPSASTLTLYEDGHPIGHSHTPQADIAYKPGGAYSHWNHTLIFSSRDNSDPRTNGHKYFATVTATLTEPVRLLLIALVCFAGVLGTLGYVLRWMGTHSVSRRALLQTMRHRICAALTTGTFRDVTSVGWVLLPFAFGLSIFVAPYIDVDSQVLAAFGLNDFVMPHFGPLYPLFTRVVNFATEVVLWPLSWQAPSGLYQPHYSGASLRVLMLLQQTITILAVSYFAVTIAKSFWIRVIVAALLYFLPSMLVYTHSVLTEGPSFALLCAATAELIKFSKFDGAHRAALARFYLFIGAASLIKHIFIIFVGMPFGCVLIMALSRHTRKQLVQSRLPVEAKHLLFGAMAVVLMNQLIANEAMRLFGIEPRSAIGRAFVYRLSPGRLQVEDEHQFFHTDAERSSIIDELKNGTADGTLRRVIEIIGRTPDPWVKPWLAVERFVRTECLADVCQHGHPWFVTDELLNSVARHTIVLADLRLWRDVGLRMLQYASPHIKYLVVFGPPSLNETIVGLSSSTLSSYPLQFGRDFGVLNGAGIVLSKLGGLLGLVSVAIISLGIRRVLVVPATLVASGLIYTLGISVVTVYTLRYSDVVSLIGVLAGLVAVADLQALMGRSGATAGGIALENTYISRRSGMAVQSPRAE